MKKLFLFWIIALFANSTFSQITITTQDIENMFHAGNVFSDFSIEGGPFNMEIGNPGLTNPGAWKLPSLNYDSSNVYLVTPASTGYAQYFPSATHVHKMSGTYMQYSFDGYGFFKVDQSGVYELGNVQHFYGSGLDTTIYDIKSQPKLNFKLPLSLGISYRKSYDSTAGQYGIYNVEEITDNVDAFGTLYVQGIWTPCLRITSVTEHRVYVSGVFTNSWKQREYSWLTKGTAYARANADTSSLLVGTVPMKEIELTYVSGTSGINEVSSVPSDFTLGQNYPNPFNPSTTISFSLQKNSFVKLNVYNVVGEKVAELVNQNLKAGSYNINFNASGLSSGIYFYRLDTENFSSVKKMTLIK